jgi:hypothetical protein
MPRLLLKDSAHCFPAQYFASDAQCAACSLQDDFRYVKAIADTRSLGGAAWSSASIIRPSFRRLHRSKTQLGSRLFELSRTLRADPCARRWCGSPSAWADIDVRAAVQPRPASRGELRVTTNDTVLVHMP